MPSVASTFLFLASCTLGQAQTDPATPYFFTTLAGASSIGSTDGTGSAARFSQPQGITLDGAGNLYVADTANHTIRKITSAGIVSTLAGKAGDAVEVRTRGDGSGSAARFTDPVGLVTDATGNIYVAGSGDSAIRKITPDGVVTTLAGGGTVSAFNVPKGIAIDTTGNLYVADTFNNAIRKVTPAGTTGLLAGGSFGSADGSGSAAQFYNPQGITVDPAGNIFVADTFNHTIRKISPLGMVTTLAGTVGVPGNIDGAASAATFTYPSCIAIDPAGNLVVADTGNSTIRKITPAGMVSTLAGQAGREGYADGSASTSLFTFPAALVSDRAGNIYVADTLNNTIRMVSTAGNVTTLAGLAPSQSVGATDGVGATARFNRSQGIAVTRDGVCYVADTGNNVIRKITATGEVSTLAGAAGQSGFADGAGTAARFTTPIDLALDGSGILYVVDGGSMIRKVTSGGLVTTLTESAIGSGGLSGAQNTPDNFTLKTSIAVGPNGEIYVGEIKPLSAMTATRAAVYKMTPGGVATDIVPLPLFPHSFITGLAVDATGTLYACDPEYTSIYKINLGSGNSAVIQTIGHFFANRLAADSSGHVFFTGSNIAANTIFRLSSDGNVGSIAGQTYQPGHQDGIGSEALFTGVGGIAIDAAGALYVATLDNTIRKGLVAAAPVIITQPQSQAVSVGGAVQFLVSAVADPAPTFQWFFNGSIFSGATSNTLSFSSARSIDAGDYTVVVTNSLGSVTSSKATLTVSAAPVTPTPTPAPASGGGGSIEIWFVLAFIMLGTARGLVTPGSRP